MRIPGTVALGGTLAAILVVTGAACGSSSSSKTTTSGPASSSPARATTSAAGGGAAAATNPTGVTLDVTAVDFSFNPTTLNAEKGKPLTINFANHGSTSHTFSLYTDDAHTKGVPDGDTGPISAGSSKTLTLSLAPDSGDLYFRCEIHPTQMTGEITVD